jgi:isoleucyl-tRNA synthetase
VASAGAVTVVLDPKITPELAQEGLAREFTSVLQQARKNAGLEVSDRIRVGWDSTDADVAVAIDRHKSSIADEVLAVEFERRPGGAESADLNGRPVRYAIAKA